LFLFYRYRRKLDQRLNLQDLEKEKRKLF